jgi:hypothetical protein
MKKKKVKGKLQPDAQGAVLMPWMNDCRQSSLGSI